ncbi:MAG: hypothetical protein ACK5PP_08810 [Acidimicrobiales bacterium]
MRRALLPAVLAVAAMVAAGCSGDGEPEPVAAGTDPAQVATSMIETTMAARLDIGPLDGGCDEPGPLAVGSTFRCAAVTETGEPVDVVAAVAGDGHLQLTTTNVIRADAVPAFERQAASMLNQYEGTNFTAEAVDCGDGTVVLGDDMVLGCGLSMPVSGDVYDLTLTITNLDARHFALAVAPTPRA